MKVRYYGHMGQRTGYGRAAIGMVRALVAAGITVEARPLTSYRSLSFDLDEDDVAALVLPDHQLDPNPDVTIVHTLPLDCGRVIETLITEKALASGKLVAYTTWEGAGPIPQSICKSLGEFDGLWVPSHHNLRAFADPLKGYLAASVIPHAFDETFLRRRPPRHATHADANRFIFYYIGAWSGRKNPSALIRAFANEFGPNDPVELWIQSSDCPKDAYIVACAATGLEQYDLPAVKFGGTYISNEAVLATHEDADVFVTASRGEAWNLPAFEAVLAGRHVIAPADQGSDDFLIGTSADRYGSMLAPAGVDVRLGAKEADGRYAMQTVGAQGLTSRATWQEPNLMQLAGFMRQAYLQKNRHLTVNYSLVDRFSYRVVGQLAKTALEEVL